MKPKIHALPGDRYGTLTVLREAKKTHGKRAVEVRCDCGREKTVRVHYLSEGTTSTCGHQPCRETGLNLDRQYKRELEQEVERLQTELERKDESLEQALRQWAMYANIDRQLDEDWIEESSDLEAQLFRECHSALSPTTAQPMGEGA